MTQSSWDFFTQVANSSYKIAADAATTLFEGAVTAVEELSKVVSTRQDMGSTETTDSIVTVVSDIAATITNAGETLTVDNPTDTLVEVTVQAAIRLSGIAASGLAALDVQTDESSQGSALSSLASSALGTLYTTAQSVVGAIQDMAAGAVSSLLGEEKDPVEFNTNIFIDILDNFKNRNAVRDSSGKVISIPIRDRAANYYLGLLVKKHLEAKAKNKSPDVSKDFDIDYKFASERLVEFARMHKNTTNGLAGDGAEIFLLAILDPENTDPETHTSKFVEFKSVNFTKAIPLNDAYVLEYIEQNLTLTSKEYAHIKAIHALDSATKILSYFDKAFGEALKQPIYLVAHTAFKVAPKWAANTAVNSLPDYSEDFLPRMQEYAETAKSYLPQLLKVIRKKGASASINDYEKTHQEAIKGLTIDAIQKLDTRPSVLFNKAGKGAKKLATKGAEKAKTATTKAKGKAAEAIEKAKKRIPKKRRKS